MSTRAESSSRPARGGEVALAAALGLGLLTLSWALLHVGFYERNQIVDTPVYQGYGEAMARGEVPYRDVAVEYPPAALPLFLLPALGPGEDYRMLFELLMWTCAVALVAFVALALGALGAGRERLLAGVAFVALAPLALGSVVLTRYDLWPAALTAGALAGLLAGRVRLGLAVLAVAVAAKLYPLVLLPLALLYARRRFGAREAWVGLVLFAAVLAAILAPFALLAPAGLADSLGRQLGRPLQIESFGAALLLAAHQLGAYEATVVSSHGSQNLSGALPAALAAGQTVVQALAVVGVAALAARRAGEREVLVAASAAALAGFVAFGKVLSPQFLIWLVPLVPLVGGRRGLTAAALAAAALVTTQLWFPSRYWDVVALEPAGWLVLARDLLLVGLFALLLGATRRARAAPGSS